jgi:hypothetical protein
VLVRELFKDRVDFHRFDRTQLLGLYAEAKIVEGALVARCQVVMPFIEVPQDDLNCHDD